jgi:hypothetical protein
LVNIIDICTGLKKKQDETEQNLLKKKTKKKMQCNLFEKNLICRNLIPVKAWCVEKSIYR